MHYPSRISYVLSDNNEIIFQDYYGNGKQPRENYKYAFRKNEKNNEFNE